MVGALPWVCLALACLSSPVAADAGPVDAALGADDECLTAEGCALNELQLRARAQDAGAEAAAAEATEGAGIVEGQMPWGSWGASSWGSPPSPPTTGASSSSWTPSPPPVNSASSWGWPPSPPTSGASGSLSPSPPPSNSATSSWGWGPPPSPSQPSNSWDHDDHYHGHDHDDHYHGHDHDDDWGPGHHDDHHGSHDDHWWEHVTDQIIGETCCMCSVKHGYTTLLFSVEDFSHMRGGRSAKQQCNRQCENLCRRRHGRMFGCYDEDHIREMDRKHGHDPHFHISMSHRGNIC